ncbi:DUF2807 domain-containing protein [Reichenbachiella agarivorans]|uniref:DUF2807 domain-containing protein n=1 Tax=Reichenbachiella agarivorans TaxID=2979464 RepID=A0ABY6CKS6_9BACT|nr:DUF2807 domain-containing protein [Reichenbachiella agarivorans]UXP31111.1 DUF2807 domain-containing protein [Reichenbachiella agarivorans]
MKKNISINISGIIFHIEEDGYTSLKSYLETINRYFSTYEDSVEIISDIESRIAEIFLSKLSDGKQIITIDDVNALIKTMGTIADFDAIESDDEKNTQEESEPEPKNEQKSQTHVDTDPAKKKLYRDDRRKVLGGVASGIAYFFSIDPLWIRLLMVALFLNVFNFGFSGGVFLAYIVLWIVIPVSTDLGDEESVKKMFRDPENQVLGGVASGIAAYFGVDITVIRLLFVLSIFLGGSGIILYIILWMITPVAKSLTEKMQMQGEPVTLSNIQQTLSKTIKTTEGEESAFVKILLFPFRVLSELFKVLGKLIGPISKLVFDILRIAFGIVIVVAGFSGIIAFLAALAVLFGVSTIGMDYGTVVPIPFEVLSQSFSVFAYLSAIILAVMPMLFLTLMGVSLLAKRWVISAAIGWSLLGVWLIGLVMALVTIPGAVASFRNEGEYKQSLVFPVQTDQELVFRLNPDDFRGINTPSMRLRASDDSVVNLVMIKESRGKTRSEAIENAKMINYRVTQEGNEFMFDPNYTFIEGAKFRAQQLKFTLYVPLGQVFVMEEEMQDVLSSSFNSSTYGIMDVDGENRWMFSDSGLKCITCESPESNEDTIPAEVDSTSEAEKITYYGEKSVGKEKSMVFEMKDFDQIDAQGIYTIYVERGDKYSVVIKGGEDLRKEVVVKQYDRILELDFINKEWNLLKELSDEEKLEVYITMPRLKSVKSAGLCTLHIDRFESDDFQISMNGASNCKLSLEVKELEVDLSGAAVLELSGQADYMLTKVSGAANLKAFGLETNVLEINASGAASAKVYAKDKLIANASGISSVRYKGDPDSKKINESGISKIKSTFE